MSQSTWRSDDPILRSPHGPYETPAAMRMHRAGWPGATIMRQFKIPASKLMAALSKAMDEEQRAHRAGRPIHDALIPKEKR